MGLQTSKEGDLLIVAVNDERIDSASAVRFKDDIFSATRTGRGRVILDLGRVVFVDSSGLGAIVAAMKSLDDSRRMDIVGLTPLVEKVFRLTRMDSVFRIFPDLLSARAAGAG
jgi:anti-sigma B factor antagonist